MNNLAQDIFDAISNKVIEIMTTEFGFTPEEVEEYSVVEVAQQDDVIRVEVRAELSYDDLEFLVGELDKVIYQFDDRAYFDMVDSGICEAFVYI